MGGGMTTRRRQSITASDLSRFLWVGWIVSGTILFSWGVWCSGSLVSQQETLGRLQEQQAALAAQLELIRGDVREIKQFCRGALPVNLPADVRTAQTGAK